MYFCKNGFSSLTDVFEMIENVEMDHFEDHQIRHSAIPLTPDSSVDFVYLLVLTCRTNPKGYLFLTVDHINKVTTIEYIFTLKKYRAAGISKSLLEFGASCLSNDEITYDIEYTATTNGGAVCCEYFISLLKDI